MLSRQIKQINIMKKILNKICDKKNDEYAVERSFEGRQKLIAQFSPTNDVTSPIQNRYLMTICLCRFLIIC